MLQRCVLLAMYFSASTGVEPTNDQPAAATWKRIRRTDSSMTVSARCFSHVERCSHGFRRSFPICASACRCAPTAAHAVNDGAFEAPTLLTNTHIFQRDILARVLTIHQLAVQLPSVESRQFVNSTGCEAQVCIHPVRHLHYKGNGPKPKQSNGCKTSVRVLGACKCMVL